MGKISFYKLPSNSSMLAPTFRTIREVSREGTIINSKIDKAMGTKTNGVIIITIIKDNSNLTIMSRKSKFTRLSSPLNHQVRKKNRWTLSAVMQCHLCLWLFLNTTWEGTSAKSISLNLS